jgi:hypothetical protein
MEVAISNASAHPDVAVCLTRLNLLSIYFSRLPDCPIATKITVMEK